MSACPTGTCIMTRPCDGPCILTRNTNLEPVDSIPGDAQCLTCGLTYAEHDDGMKAACNAEIVRPMRPKVVQMPTREPDLADQVSVLKCLEDVLADARTTPGLTHTVVLLISESPDGGFHIDQRCAGDQKMSDTLMYLTVATNRVTRAIEGRD